MTTERDQEIIKGFAEAGLKAVPATSPVFVGAFGRGARQAFGLAVRGRGKTVHFQFQYGAKENKVQILHTDPNHRQLVLLVKEPAGEIKWREWDTDLHKNVVRSEKVSGNTRRFLVGFDERDLFMCQLPAAARITTVQQAHEVLRNPSLPEKKKVIRQGEWFFQPVTTAELDQIKKLLPVVKKKYPIGGPGRGKPHTADEYLEILAKDLPPLVTGSGWDAARPRARITPEANKGTVQGMFVRGKVRHLDHATKQFLTWHRVVRNTEDRGSNARWID